MIVTAKAQERKEYDFSGLNYSTLSVKQLRDKVDSLYYNPTYAQYIARYDSLHQLIEWVNAHYNIQHYVSVNAGIVSTSSRLSELNKAFDIGNFGSVAERMNAFHFSFSIRTKKRWILGYGVEDAFKQTVKNGDARVEVDGSSFDIYMGYDILNKPKIQLYPYVSVGFNSLEVDLFKKDANSTILTYDGFLTEFTYTSLERRTTLLNYALQLNYHLLYSKRHGGIILETRYGRNVALGEGKWLINNEKSKFKSDDQFRTSFFLVALKFYLKTDNGK